MAGNQQAALFGEACFRPGQAKATYCTGSFVLINVGGSPTGAPEGLLKTAASVLSGERQYAFEGAVLASGAAIQWLRDGLGLLAEAQESENGRRRRAPDLRGFPDLAQLGRRALGRLVHHRA